MIYYRDGVRYVLEVEAKTQTKILGYSVKTAFLELTPDGFLYQKVGYAWNGVGTNPVQSFFLSKPKLLRPSLVHDGLCQLMELGLLPQYLKPNVDQCYHDLCLENGVWHWQADLSLGLLLKFGNYSVRKQIILEAP